MSDDNVIQADFEVTGEEVETKAPWHALLQVWRDVLAAAKVEREKKVTPQWANRIVASFPEISFADMNAFKVLFYDRMLELHELVVEEIAKDDECLNVTSAPEDLEHNHQHYLELLLAFQLKFLSWELGWDCEAPDAAIQNATFGEAWKFVFGGEGLIAHLDQINLAITDEERESWTTAMREYAEEHSE